MIELGEEERHMTTAIRSVVGKLGSKYSPCCHSKGRTVANMVRVGDFQIRSSVVSNYNIDRDVLFSISKPPPSYGYSSRHPFLFGNHHKKAPPVLHLEYFKSPRVSMILPFASNAEMISTFMVLLRILTQLLSYCVCL